MRAGLATAAALAAVTTTVAASTITCSDQIKRKQRDNEVSHPCSQRTKQNKHNRWSVCSNRNIFGSSTFHFSHCDLSFGFKLGEFHMLSIVFADLWTNKTFGVFIEFTEVSAIFNRLGDQILYRSIPFSCFQNENENKAHMSSCHGRKDTIIDICARIDRSVERSIDRSVVWRLSFYICTPKKLCERIRYVYWTQWFDSKAIFHRANIQFNASQKKADRFSTGLARRASCKLHICSVIDVNFVTITTIIPRQWI